MEEKQIGRHKMVRETYRHTDRQRQTHGQTQTFKHLKKMRENLIDEQKDRQTGRPEDLHADWETCTQTDKQTKKLNERQIGRPADRQTDR